MIRHNRSRRIQYMQRCDWCQWSRDHWVGKSIPSALDISCRGWISQYLSRFGGYNAKFQLFVPLYSSTRSVHCKVAFLTVLDFVPVAVAALTLPPVAAAALALPLHSKHGGTHHCHCWLTMDNHQHQRHSNQCQHQHQPVSFSILTNYLQLCK